MKRYLSVLLLSLTVASARADWRWAGDINNDGELTASDLVSLIEAIKTKKIPVDKFNLYDVNQDGQVDAEDVCALRDIIIAKREKAKVWIPETVPVDGPDDNQGYD